MRLNRLDLNQLICLDALLTEQSVSRAAERVHLSQPAMSAALARLRNHFGDPLLLRVGRSMIITPFGKTLQEPVRNVLLQANAVVALRPENNPARMQRDITLVSSDYVVSIILHDAMRRAATEAPGIRIHVRPVSELFDDLFDSGELELIIASTAAFVSGHPSEKLFNESYSCIAWEKHPEIGTTLSEDQYYGFGHVSVEWARGRIQTHEHTAAQKQGGARRNEIAVANFNMVPGFLVGTRRIATIQTRLAKQMAAQWPLKVLPCPIKIPSFRVGMQWNKHLSDDAAMTWFRGLLRDTVKTL